jgi:hypothetical protein
MICAMTKLSQSRFCNDKQLGAFSVVDLIPPIQNDAELRYENKQFHLSNSYLCVFAPLRETNSYFHSAENLKIAVSSQPVFEMGILPHLKNLWAITTKLNVVLYLTC